MSIWSILRPFDIFLVIWYILWQLVKFCQSILLPFDIICGSWLNVLVIWYIFPILVCCTKKNLATLVRKCFDVTRIQSWWKYFFLDLTLYFPQVYTHTQWQWILKKYHIITWWDSIPRPINPICSVVGVDDTTRPRCPGLTIRVYNHL
jgi:hypothetical protein